MIHVPQLNVGDKIPKRFMLPDAEREAADFLGMLMSIEIPASNDRLNVPMIATAEKIEAENANRTPLEAFIAEKCFYAPGKMILFADFYDTFIRHTDADDVVSWSKIRVGRELPAEHPRGRDPKTGSVNVGNISWSPVTEDELKQPKLKVTVDGAKNTFLVPENEA